MVSESPEAAPDPLFYARLMANVSTIRALYDTLYAEHTLGQSGFESLMRVVIKAAQVRPDFLVKKDTQKAEKGAWFLRSDIAGMSLYVDRFAGNLNKMGEKLPYFKELGVNFLHLMPLFESPPEESDGGYAVSDFRSVDARFGHINDLKKLVQQMNQQGMYLMLDIVLNHTSHRHEWAQKARKGDEDYQDYFYFFEDRQWPDAFEKTMPDIFPESAPGSFTWVAERQQWVMTVFHGYQWDLNYRNPRVLCEMLDTVLFYANLGVDILRVDAPAFIWKELGTTCQNLPEAHTLLKIIRLCVEIAAPGMALLGEAIVAPKEIMKYFGTDEFLARECDFAYNATLMATQWDALATGDARILLASQPDLQQKPYGTSWITYTRCHDDIGLGYEDAAIAKAGFTSFEHRKFIKDYYSGAIEYSPATGALFSVNPVTQDARISGTLASLCGLEKALETQDEAAIELAIRRILLMQAMSCFVGGIPMLYYGDEWGCTNDYSYRNDPAKNYDNRWMHRPLIDWKKAKKASQKGSIEHKIFTGTQQLLQFRRAHPLLSDEKNTRWLGNLPSPALAGFVRERGDEKLIFLFNFSAQTQHIYRGLLLEMGIQAPFNNVFSQERRPENEPFLALEGYGFCGLRAG